MPNYKAMKAIVAREITAKIGLSALRAACPHFHDWLTILEGLAAR